MHSGIWFFVTGGCNERNNCVWFLGNLLLIRRFFFFIWERLMFSVSSRSDPDENNFADSLVFFLFFRPPLPPTGFEPEPKKNKFWINLNRFESIWINFESIWINFQSIWTSMQYEPWGDESWSSRAGLISEFKAVLEVRLAPGVKYLVRESTKPEINK